MFIWNFLLSGIEIKFPVCHMIWSPLQFHFHNLHGNVYSVKWNNFCSCISTVTATIPASNNYNFSFKCPLALHSLLTMNEKFLCHMKYITVLHVYDTYMCIPLIILSSMLKIRVSSVYIRYTN